jgi:hypothetical protein
MQVSKPCEVNASAITGMPQTLHIQSPVEFEILRDSSGVLFGGVLIAQGVFCSSFIRIDQSFF